MQEIIGFSGAFLLAICAVPQAWQCIVQGHGRGLNSSFLLSWYIGELLMLLYVYKYIGTFGPLFWNYAINVALLTIIVRYKYLERK